MHFTKLFLAGSFAVAAAFRGGEVLLVETGASSGSLLSFLATPTGFAVETCASLVVGGLWAVRLASTKKRKAVQS